MLLVAPPGCAWVAELILLFEKMFGCFC
jgi:hypothetical protein